VAPLLWLPAYKVGNLYCYEPPADKSRIDDGENCWCLREAVRSEVMWFYGTEEGYLRTRGANELIALCTGRELEDNVGPLTRDALFPAGLRFLAEDLAAARAVNPGLSRRWPAPEVEPGGRKPMVREAQKILRWRGFAPGPADGNFGPRTEAAVKAFQATVGLPVTGSLDPALLGLLRNSIMMPGSVSMLDVEGW
jgi:hypothetical protein